MNSIRFLFAFVLSTFFTLGCSDQKDSADSDSKAVISTYMTQGFMLTSLVHKTAQTRLFVTCQTTLVERERAREVGLSVIEDLFNPNKVRRDNEILRSLDRMQALFDAMPKSEKHTQRLSESEIAALSIEENQACKVLQYYSFVQQDLLRSDFLVRAKKDFADYQPLAAKSQQIRAILDNEENPPDWDYETGLLAELENLKTVLWPAEHKVISWYQLFSVLLEPANNLDSKGETQLEFERELLRFKDILAQFEVGVYFTEREHYEEIRVLLSGMLKVVADTSKQAPVLPSPVHEI